MQIDDEVLEKARRFYGYGRWDAPYWFIGPEEGQDKKEDPRLRVEAWLHFDRAELCDCREFHECVGITKWHREKPPPAPPLQFTWRKLMLLLKAFLGEVHDNNSLRDYQRLWWGRKEGKTCVIELSGLPANNSKVSGEQMLRLFNRDQKKIDCIRQERIAFIRKKMLKEEPELVVIYGKGQWKHWESIFDRSPSEESIQGFPARTVKCGSTKIVFTPHPTRPGMGNAYWVKLGEKLRQMS